MTLYFSYGSNMDPGQMAVRCPGAVPVGAARLPAHRLVFVWDSPGWGGGVGSIVEDAGDHVWGVLWDLAPEHEAALDEYEGVGGGVYVRATVRLECDGSVVTAYTYVATSDRAKPPSNRYLGALLRGARAFRLPAQYVRRLEGLGT